VPGNVTGIVMRAAPGDEMTCRAHEMDVDVKGFPVCRGIISYCATSTMGEATDIQSWFELMDRKSGEDLTHHKITMPQKPMLQVCGDPSVKLIGGWRTAHTIERA